DVRNAIAICECEEWIVGYIRQDSLQATTGLGLISSIDQCDVPRLCGLSMHLEPILRQMKCNVRHVDEIIGEILLDKIALVAQANDELIDTMRTVYFHDMPKNGTPTDLDHRLRSNRGLFGKARSKASSQDNRLHHSSRARKCLGESLQ